MHYDERVKTSLFDLYKIGVGPSSSHTMGPMRAAFRFIEMLHEHSLLARTAAVRADLYGSLALTGIGHGTDRAVILGLSEKSRAPPTPPPWKKNSSWSAHPGVLGLGGVQTVPFREAECLLFHRDQMTPPGSIMQHPNGVRFLATDRDGRTLLETTFFSIGGGFIVQDGSSADTTPVMTTATVPYSFSSAAELLATCRAG